MAVHIADNQDALGLMWETHRAAIRRLLLSLTRDIDVTDDLLQETYLCARAGIAAYRGGDARAWLAAIARNVYRTHARRRYLRSEVPWETLAEDDGGVPPAYDSHDLLAIRQALSALSPALRNALIMKHYAGFTYLEIARRQRCPLGTAKWRVSEALDKLRLVLLPERRKAMAGNAEMHGINLVNYAYGVLSEEGAAKVRAHLAVCDCCRRDAVEIKRVVMLLDALEMEYRQMHFIELDENGLVTLYSSTTFRNDSEETLTTLDFGSGCTPDHAYVNGEEVAFTRAGREKIPNADGTIGEVDKYVVTLNRPAQPGEQLSELLVMLPSPGFTHAMPIGEGRYRFSWNQGPGSTHEFAYVQAIRLPAGAQLLATEPPPDETRGDGAITLVWRQVLPPGEFFNCTVEYRLGDL